MVCNNTLFLIMVPLAWILVVININTKERLYNLRWLTKQVFKPFRWIQGTMFKRDSLQCFHRCSTDMIFGMHVCLFFLCFRTSFKACVCFSFTCLLFVLPTNFPVLINDLFMSNDSSCVDDIIQNFRFFFWMNSGNKKHLLYIICHNPSIPTWRTVLYRTTFNENVIWYNI